MIEPMWHDEPCPTRGSDPCDCVGSDLPTYDDDPAAPLLVPPVVPEGET